MRVLPSRVPRPLIPLALRILDCVTRRLSGVHKVLSRAMLRCHVWSSGLKMTLDPPDWDARKQELIDRHEAGERGMTGDDIRAMARDNLVQALPLELATMDAMIRRVKFGPRLSAADVAVVESTMYMIRRADDEGLFDIHGFRYELREAQP